jgi:hypothetical protein
MYTTILFVSHPSISMVQAVRVPTLEWLPKVHNRLAWTLSERFHGKNLYKSPASPPFFFFHSTVQDVFNHHPFPSLATQTDSFTAHHFRQSPDPTMSLNTFSGSKVLGLADFLHKVARSLGHLHALNTNFAQKNVQVTSSLGIFDTENPTHLLTPYGLGSSILHTPLQLVSHPCIISFAGVILSNNTITDEQHPRIVRDLQILDIISTIWAETTSLTAAQHYSKVPASDIPLCTFRSLALLQRIIAYIDHLNEHGQAALYDTVSSSHVIFLASALACSRVYSLSLP